MGISKTKELIRREYWFPGMNNRIENVEQSCFSHPITTNTHHMEPVKMTELPQRLWDTVEVDFCGPFPNNNYAFFLIHQYSRYPEVEFIRSISIKPVLKQLKNFFATHKVPKTVQTDNRPPFNSREFRELAREMGFHHKVVTPRHSQLQGQVEGFNRPVNKTAAIANQEGIDLQEATYDMLQAYRATPHPATKTTPYRSEQSWKITLQSSHHKTVKSETEMKGKNNHDK